jgi:hypothetical protein
MLGSLSLVSKINSNLAVLSWKGSASKFDIELITLKENKGRN